MKRLYISAARLPTGKAHGLQIMYMCEEFARAGAAVELIVPRKHNFFLGADPFEYYKVARNFTIRSIPIPDLGSKSNMFSSLAFYIDMLAFAFSLVFLRVIRPGVTVYCRDYPLLFLCSPRRNRVAFEIHDIPPRRRIFLRALRHATTIIAITQGLKDALVKLGVEQGRVVVAPDAVHLHDFEKPESKESARKRLGLPPDKKIALYVGRIDAWKGTDVFFEAAKLLPRGVTAVVMGDGVMKREKLAQVHPTVIHISGRPYHELADNQAAADVLVLPNSGRFEISARYTSPLKLFSYMTSGKPIVASDLPSIREVVDERSAYLVAPDNPQALARGIAEALSDPRAYEKAARARELVKNYTWERRARHILATINAYTPTI